MKTYTIDSENTIAAHAGTPVDAVDSFSSEKELAVLVAGWRMSRLVKIWNRLAGIRPFGDLKPVKKFENRAVAVARIWTAVSRLTPDVAQHAADVAPVAAPAKEDPRRKNERPRRARTGTGPKHLQSIVAS